MVVKCCLPITASTVCVRHHNLHCDIEESKSPRGWVTSQVTKLTALETALGALCTPVCPNLHQIWWTSGSLLCQLWTGHHSQHRAWEEGRGRGLSWKTFHFTGVRHCTPTHSFSLNMYVLRACVVPDTIVDLGRELSRTEKISVSTVHTCPDQRHRREASEMFPGHTTKKIKEGDMTGRGLGRVCFGADGPRGLFTKTWRTWEEHSGQSELLVQRPESRKKVGVFNRKPGRGDGGKGAEEAQQAQLRGLSFLWTVMGSHWIGFFFKLFCF